MAQYINQTSDFAIIQTQRKPADPMALAKALAAYRRTPVQDQVIAAKNSFGIVAEHLPEPQALMLSELLKAAGLPCAVIRSSQVPILPDVQMMKRAETGWDKNLILIAAAAIRTTSTRTRIEHQGPSAGQKILSAGILLTTGLPIKIGPKEQTIKREQTESELAFYGDFLYQEPGQPLTRRRVDAQNFDYAYLNERRLYQVLGNFKLLLADSVQGSPDAWRNHGATILLEGHPMITMPYGTLDDLERETRWLLTLQGLK